MKYMEMKQALDKKINFVTMMKAFSAFRDVISADSRTGAVCTMLNSRRPVNSPEMMLKDCSGI